MQKKQWCWRSIHTCCCVIYGRALRYNVPMRSKILFSLLVGIITALMSFYWSRLYWLDLNPPLCSARHLLAGLEPYAGCATDYGGLPAAQYPMTAILAFVPVAWLPGAIPTALVWGAINALLTFGIPSTLYPEPRPIIGQTSVLIRIDLEIHCPYNASTSLV